MLSQPSGRPNPDFAEVFQTQTAYVWRSLRRLGVREADVEDVCQEVFMVVHRKLSTFEGRSKLTTWIYGICVRTASDYRRRAHRRHEEPTDSPPDERESAPQLKELERRRALAQLDNALDTLDEARRAVFVLYEVEELSMPEVAKTLGIPLQTAYSRLHAARKQVRHCMTTDALPEGPR